MFLALKLSRWANNMLKWEFYNFFETETKWSYIHQDHVLSVFEAIWA